MNPFEMVVLIVAIVMIASVAKARYRAAEPRRDEAEAPRPLGPDPENRALREELRALKARVVTLERIATDRSTDLDREIEALRDRT